MTKYSKVYYTKARNIRKQLPTLWPFGLFFVLTVLYASGLRNHDVRVVLFGLSLAYPLLVVFVLFAAMPKLNPLKLGADGIHITTLGLMHRTIRWADIKRMRHTQLWNIEGLGIEYNASSNRSSWMVRNRKRMFGWDEFVPDAYSSDGSSFAMEISKEFKLRSKSAK